MRIWDVHPGYLSRRRLLGEHAELHGLMRVLERGHGGYARHPETQRWRGRRGALAHRHALQVAEMALRGYRHRSPIDVPPDTDELPPLLLAPADQFRRLREKYASGEQGRVPLPRTAQELWAQHKYAVLARDPESYRAIGRAVARGTLAFEELAEQLVRLLWRRPTPGGLRNALAHMWGYVTDFASSEERRRAQQDPVHMLRLTQRLARQHAVPYLLHSVALSELAVWVDAD
ncbi:DUF1722 domain-containing protein [Rhodothermus marinus]|uniref:DUF1722 domain-containing protein n=1 Tax=Rhodothermus marinus TaxID=29549 RepID=UPI0037CC7234